MPIAVVLRNSIQVNLFADVLLSAVRLEGITEILLCSGFFQEGRGKFSASAHRDLARAMTESEAEVITVGVHNGGWRHDYESFVNALRAEGASVDSRRMSSYHWHAKVAIVSDGEGPLAGIIGSSNMTRSAFGDSAPFNFEADVVLWSVRAEARGFDVLGETEAANRDVRYDLIRANYSPSENFGLSEADRLAELRAQILGATQSA